MTEKSLNRSLEEKRKLYMCEERYCTLDNIPTWYQHYHSNRKDIENLRGAYVTLLFTASVQINDNSHNHSLNLSNSYLSVESLFINLLFFNLLRRAIVAIVLPVALFIGIMIIFATNIQFRSNNFFQFLLADPL